MMMIFIVNGKVLTLLVLLIAVVLLLLFVR